MLLWLGFCVYYLQFGQVPEQWGAIPCAQIHEYAQLSITVGLTV
jgi:hypothetical protein